MVVYSNKHKIVEWIMGKDKKKKKKHQVGKPWRYILGIFIPQFLPNKHVNTFITLP